MIDLIFFFALKEWGTAPFYVSKEKMGFSVRLLLLNWRGDQNVFDLLMGVDRESGSDRGCEGNQETKGLSS